MNDLVMFALIVVLMGGGGLALGIFFLAPRITRLLDRKDEEPGAGDD